ncbi:NUDIX hydrolase [Streptosporangium sp. NPDC048865]|uniref:NUDIX hydrolase n=1 Tax=Streptosporangium sp. NPDC048865 TaxID=3155766 RepID=UPI003412DFCC
MTTTWTHPDVFTRGIAEGWAEAETDPTCINWAERQAAAAIWFDVIDGRPVKPGESTGIEHGRGENGHWGEKQNGDAVVLVCFNGTRWVLLIERDDDKGWGFPGGGLDEGEAPLAGVIRELAEESGLVIPGAAWRMLEARIVPDTRSTDESWMVSWPAVTNLGEVDALPAVQGASDARRAEWVRADTYDVLAANLKTTYHGQVFTAHQPLLAELFDTGQIAEAIAGALYDRDLEKARDLFDRAVEGSRAALGALAKQLAANVEIPKGTIVVGFGIDVWGNPHRDGYAWRCGDCRWTGSNYLTAPGAQGDAEEHAIMHQEQGEPVPAVQDYATA